MNSLRWLLHLFGFPVHIWVKRHSRHRYCAWCGAHQNHTNTLGWWPPRGCTEDRITRD
jgi:hypothetical protein